MTLSNSTPTWRYFALTFGLIAALLATPALAKKKGGGPPPPPPPPPPATSQPDTADVNLKVSLLGVNLDDDIYLDDTYNLYSDPDDYETNPEAGPFFGKKVQPGIHYIDTENPSEGNLAAAFQFALQNVEVEVLVWGDDNVANGDGLLDPTAGEFPDAESGNVAFVFKNTALSNPSGETFHIKDIFFDDPTHTAGNPTPYANDFLSNMQVYTPHTTALNTNYSLVSSADGAGAGTYSNGSNFPHWDPFNEGVNRSFSADFAATGGKITKDQSLALVFDYSNPSGSLAVFAHKVNAVRFGMHVGGLPDGESIKLWAEMPVFATPEPGTWALLSTGLVGLIGYGWRRKKV